MSIKGITLTARFTGPVTFEDEWIDRFYSSFETNMAIVSCDVAADDERAELTVTLGIDALDALDTDSLVEGVARDALTRAIAAANEDDGHGTDDAPIVRDSPVKVFA